MLDVLHIDNHVIGVRKPANIPSQGDKTGDLSMLEMVRSYLGERFKKTGHPYVGLVHRLDRPVGGVMVFARTSKGASRLSDQFRRKTPKKTYWALVEGRFEGEATLSNHLIPRSGNRSGVVEKPTSNSKEATMSVKGLKVGKTLSLVEVHPQSGRKHQIRVQLAHAGHPIVGDRKYGSRKSYLGKGIALVAKSLSVEHPTTKTPIDLDFGDTPFPDYPDFNLS